MKKQLRVYEICKADIDRYSSPVFFRNEHRGRGLIPSILLSQVLEEFVVLSQSEIIDETDINFLLQKFELDQTKFVTYSEFKMMLKLLGGLKEYNRRQIIDKRRRYRIDKRLEELTSDSEDSSSKDSCQWTQ